MRPILRQIRAFADPHCHLPTAPAMRPAGRVRALVVLAAFSFPACSRTPACGGPRSRGRRGRCWPVPPESESAALVNVGIVRPRLALSGSCTVAKILPSDTTVTVCLTRLSSRRRGRQWCYVCCWYGADIWWCSPFHRAVPICFQIDLDQV
jgi:hypothetical protein